MSTHFLAIAGLRVALFGAIFAFAISVVVSGAIGVDFVRVTNWTMVAVIVFSGLFLVFYLVGGLGHLGQGNVGTGLGLIFLSFMWIINVFSYTVGFGAYQRWFIDDSLIRNAERYLVDEARYWIVMPLQWAFGESDPLELINLYELQTFYGTIVASVIIFIVTSVLKTGSAEKA